jgi:hypothetical protein
MKKRIKHEADNKPTRFVSATTPWGTAQEAKEIAPGIIRYDTASHGGYFLSKERNAKVPAILKKSTCAEQGLKGWYEEDCDWAIVVYTFKECFDDVQFNFALQTLQQHYSAAWAKLQKDKG